jgi:hypothetical protein
MILYDKIENIIVASDYSIIYNHNRESESSDESH